MEVAPTASTSLLTAAGGYALTDTIGGFNITGLYNCPTTSSLVYMLALGGDSGSGTNNARAMMAALGNCATLKANAATTFVTVDEVTTVGTIYSLAE